MTQGSSFHAPTLLAVAARCGLRTVGQTARQPGMQGVFRVTISYHDRRARDTVTTITRAAVGLALDIVFDGAVGKPLHHAFDPDRYDAFARALTGVGFDHLKDAPNLPAPGKGDVWLIERAAGSFAHGLLLAPDHAEGVYSRLVNAVRNGLPEALRQVQ
ncbi:MAG TPA: hypothetical protein VER79_04910 [Candidatus Limnocylindrales bacterium]|nr:hypothetical protein [Candidatus Limnocylindrales bacterium]